MLDEPLAILAAAQWINQIPTYSLFERLRGDSREYPFSRKGFEAYLGFHLRKRFESRPELDAVFAFREDFAQRIGTDLTWQHEKFELVTVVASADVA